MYAIKLSDTLPALTVRLRAAGVAYNVSGALSVALRYRAETDPATATVARTCTVLDAVNGVVSYPWTAGDLTAAGRYAAEFKVDFGGDRVITFPDNGLVYFDVVPNA